MKYQGLSINNRIQQDLLSYFQQHQLQRFDMHSLIQTLGWSTLETLHAYNTLNQNHQLITAYDDEHHAYLIEVFNHPLVDLIEHLKSQHSFFIHTAEQLNISDSQLLWYYCDSLGIKENRYQKIKSKLIIS